jgi:hypothetical protein
MAVAAMAEAMLAPMAKMLEAMFEQSIKNFDETIKHPEQAVAELKTALDEVSSRTHSPSLVLPVYLARWLLLLLLTVCVVP